ncbi:hypothetical protein ACF0H5_011219 [Mactra antiquata]
MTDQEEPPTKRVKTGHVRQYYDIQRRSERTSRKFRTKAQVYDVTLHRFDESYEFTSQLFNDMVNQLYDKCHVRSNDQVRFSIQHPELDFGIHIPFDQALNIRGETLLEEIEKVAQSNQAFRIHDGDTQLEITHIEMPQGSGRMPFKATDLSQLVNLKRSLVRIDNSTDSMCLARSIVVGRCKANQNSTPEWKTRWNMIRQSKKIYKR